MTPLTETVSTPAAPGQLTHSSRLVDALGLCMLVLSLVPTWVLAPAWREARLLDPAYGAVILGGLAIAVILALRALGRRGSLIERWVLASFLAGMPCVYLAALLAHPVQAGWLALELAGVAIFGALAWLGLRRSPWYLALGILAHGLGWDAWHHANTSFIADWYTLLCLGADVGIAGYVATQVRVLAR